MCLACSVLCNGCSHVPIHTFLLALNHICCEAYPADPPPTPGPVALLNVLRCVNPDGLQTAAHQGGEQPRSGYVGVFVLRPKAQDSSAASVGAAVWGVALFAVPRVSAARRNCFFCGNASLGPALEYGVVRLLADSTSGVRIERTARRWQRANSWTGQGPATRGSRSAWHKWWAASQAARENHRGRRCGGYCPGRLRLFPHLLVRGKQLARLGIRRWPGPLAERRTTWTFQRSSSSPVSPIETHV